MSARQKDEEGSIAGKVAEVFLTASAAFQRLGDLTLELHAAPVTDENMRWTDAEVGRLQGALARFNEELLAVGQSVQSRTEKQVKHDLKRKSHVLAEADSAADAKSSGPSAHKRPGGGGRPPGGRPPGGSTKSYAAAATPRPAPTTPSNASFMQGSFPDVGPPPF